MSSASRPAVVDVRDPVRKAGLIFASVRDGIRCDPYSTNYDPALSGELCGDSVKGVVRTEGGPAYRGGSRGRHSALLGFAVRNHHRGLRCVPGWDVPTSSSITDTANCDSTTAG